MMERSLMTLARMQKRTASLLNEIRQIAGVTGVFVCDNSGRPFATWPSGAAASSAFNQIGLNVAQMYAAFASQVGQAREIEIHYQQHVVVTQDVGSAFVVTLCTPQTDRAMLRMSLNVAAEPLEKDADIQRELARVTPPRANTLSEGYLDAAGQLLIHKLNPPG